MTKSDIFLYSEPYSPTGNVTSQGVLNQLGRPRLDIFTVLVREAVQNSWDARADDKQPLRFGISAWTVGSSQRTALQWFFKDIPLGLNLHSALHEDQKLMLLSIYDRGTIGLGGPTRADQQLDAEGAYDFVDFLRNVGQPPDRRLAGGTYGYGKAAFYRASRAHTILVHTRCQWQGHLEGRFIGAALGEPFEQGKVRYTGRHWWGRQDGGIAEPLITPRADKAAAFLQLPDYGDGERGTTITIVQPVFEDDPQQTMVTMRDALLWYFWPKMMLNHEGKPSIEFEMWWEHDPMPIPNPEQFPPLDLFVKAAQNLRTSEGSSSRSLFGKIMSVDAIRPKQHLGKLSLEKGLANPRIYGDESASPISKDERCHHVALMRQPQLVVTYLACETLPSDAVEYAGVFITDKEVDRVFADAEPPTHDDWIPTYLEERSQRTFVNVALERIKKYASEYIRPAAAPSVSGQTAVPLGAFADMLGQLLPGRVGFARTALSLPRRNERRDSIEIPSTAFIPDVNRERTTPPIPNQNKTPVFSEDTPVLASSPRESPTLTHNDTEKTSTSFSPILEQPEASVGREQLKPDAQPIEPRLTPPQLRGAIRVRLYDEGEFILLEDGTPAVGFRLEVSQTGGPATARIWFSAQAVLDDGSFENDPPEGAAIPQVLFWQHPSGQAFAGSDSLEIDESSIGEWWVVINLVDDAGIGVDIRVEQIL